MTGTKLSPVNSEKLERVAEVVHTLLNEVLRSGFHGKAKLKLVIANGTIQQICRTVERVDKQR
jgi:hypothetical protein